VPEPLAQEILGRLPDEFREVIAEFTIRFGKGGTVTP
jgi:hypothetical protein